MWRGNWDKNVIESSFTTITMPLNHTPMILSDIVKNWIIGLAMMGYEPLYHALRIW